MHFSGGINRPPYETADGYLQTEELAKGGIGAVITGFTSVVDDDRYFGGMARLSDDGLIPEHQRLTEICHAESCLVIIGRLNAFPAMCAIAHRDMCVSSICVKM